MSRILPILFNTDMVRAILDGGKTATRRLVKSRSKKACGFYVTFRKSDNAFMGVYDYDENERQFDNPQIPPYQPGDILYVRETWQCWRAHRYEATADIMFRAGGKGVKIEFKNGNTDSIDRKDYDSFVGKWYSYHGEWRPSIHMPKEVARIWLKVIDVKVERLQEIKNFREEGIALSESCEKCYLACGGCNPTNSPTGCDNEVEAFANLWDSTIRKNDINNYGWRANPWVWVIEFERCGKPEEL
ncbi:MAG: hypothetical protein NC347_06935 [Clostridium sp.]|nr:hypothetical protein [Clostridium sp.]